MRLMGFEVEEEKESEEMAVNRIRVIHIAECIGGVDRYLHSLIKYMDHDKFENIMVLSKLYENKGYEKLAEQVEFIDIPHQRPLLENL